MNDILNKDKYIILAKEEYDNLVQASKSNIESYENKIKDLSATLTNLEENKGYISYNLYVPWPDRCASIHFIEGSEDGELIQSFIIQNEIQEKNLIRKINHYLAGMSVLKFFRLKHRRNKPFNWVNFFNELEEK